MPLARSKRTLLAADHIRRAWVEYCFSVGVPANDPATEQHAADFHAFVDTLIDWGPRQPEPTTSPDPAVWPELCVQCGGPCRNYEPTRSD